MADEPAGRCARHARALRGLAPRRGLRFLLDFLRVDSGFELQELNLLLAELLALGTILLSLSSRNISWTRRFSRSSRSASCARSASVSISDRASPGKLSRSMPGTGANAIANIVRSFNNRIILSNQIIRLVSTFFPPPQLRPRSRQLQPVNPRRELARADRPPSQPPRSPRASQIGPGPAAWHGATDRSRRNRAPLPACVLRCRTRRIARSGDPPPAGCEPIRRARRIP